MKSLSPAEIEALIAALPGMPPAEQTALLADLDALEERKGIEDARDDFLVFCKRVYPGFKEGPHHRFMRPILHEVLAGDAPRVTISMPPRFGKSETVAYLFVAWYLGHNPSHHIIMVTHTADLSATFGRKVRDLLDSPVYQAIFPDTVVSRDKSAAGNWTTTMGGKYLAIGIGANVAGHGAHLLIADDLVSENAMLANPETAFDNAWTYMQVGPLQRLMPSGRIVMIGTRWGKRDPIGRALQWAVDNEASTPWLEVRFPAILPSGKSLWAEQWPIEQLTAKKAGMLPQFWAAQYQQEPTSEEGALIKREWWKIWEKERPPEVTFIIQAWDTAHEAKTRADYSACTTWGVWETEDKETRIILLDAIKGRWEFPELKIRVMEQWKLWEPDSLIVEKKAAGAPLIQELRRMNIVVMEVSPSRGKNGTSNDKYARMNAISDLFSSGIVYAPDRRWAHEVIEECASFPFGQNDDLCLAADTEIMMGDGTRCRIDGVAVGDLVHTPLGPRTVRACGYTGDREVLLLRVGNRTLRGTGGHLVATNKGWKRLDTVGMLDTIKVSQTTGEIVWHFLQKTASLLSLFSLMGVSTTGIQKQRKQIIVGTLCAVVERICCTLTFGCTPMAPYPQAGTFTIRIKTSATTRWTISKRSLPRHTEPSIWKKPAQEVAAPQHWHTSLASMSPQKHGTAAQRGLSGTGKLQASNSKKGAPHALPETQHLLNAGRVHSRRIAKFVARSFLRLLRGAYYAATRVPLKHTAYASGKQPVFNLSVEGASCYYANGILVHNCDCVQMSLARFRNGGFIRLPSDFEDGEEDFRSRQRAYYG